MLSDVSIIQFVIIIKLFSLSKVNSFEVVFFFVCVRSTHTHHHFLVEARVAQSTINSSRTYAQNPRSLNDIVSRVFFFKKGIERA